MTAVPGSLSVAPRANLAKPIMASFVAYMRESRLSPMDTLAGALTPVTYGIVVISGYGKATGALLLGSVAAGLWGSFYTQAAMIVLRERRSGTLQQLAASPVPLWVPLFGRLLAAACQTFAIAPVIAAVIAALFGGIHDFESVRWIAALVVTAFGLLGMSLLLMGAISRWRYSAGMINGLFGMVVFLGGFFVPLSVLPLVVRTVGLALPPAWAIQAVRPATAHPWTDLGVAALLGIGWLAAGACYLSGTQRRLRKMGFYQF